MQLLTLYPGKVKCRASTQITELQVFIKELQVICPENEQRVCGYGQKKVREFGVR